MPAASDAAITFAVARARALPRRTLSSFFPVKPGSPRGCSSDRSFPFQFCAKLNEVQAVAMHTALNSLLRIRLQRRFTFAFTRRS